MSIQLIIIIAVVILSIYIFALSVIKSKARALVYYRECGDLWRAEGAKPWHLRDYGKVYNYILEHPTVSDTLMKEYFSNKIFDEKYDLYRLGCQRVRDRDDIMIVFSMIAQWKGVPPYNDEVERLVSKMDYFTLSSTRMTSVLRWLDIKTYIESVRSPAHGATMTQFIKDLFSTWEAAEENFASGNFKTAYSLYTFADKTEEWMNCFRESVLFIALAEGSDSANFQKIFDIYIRYYDVFPDAKRHAKLAVKKINSTDTIIAKCFGTYNGNEYNVSLVRDELNKTLSYLAEHEENWEDLKVFAEVFRYMKAYDEEQGVLSMMANRYVPMGDTYNARLGKLRSGLAELEDEEERSTSEEQISISQKQTIGYDYRPLKWKKEQFFDYFERLTLSRTRLTHSIVLGEWLAELPITAKEYMWDLSEFHKALVKKLGEVMPGIVQCVLCNAGPMIGEEIDAVPALAMTTRKQTDDRNSKDSFPEVTLILHGLQDRTDIRIQLLTLYTAKYREVITMGENREVLNRALSIKNKGSKELDTYIKTIREVVLGALDYCLNQAPADAAISNV